MNKLARAVAVLVVLISRGGLYAQEFSYFHIAPYTIPLAQIQPQRPLVLSEKEAHAYTGVAANLSKGNVGDGWLIPLGGSFGLLPELELGLHSTLLVDDAVLPVKGYNFVNQFQIYGRLVIFEQNLAAELAIDIPTVSASRFGLVLNVPGRWWSGPFDAFGLFRFNYFNYASMTGGTAHDIMVGLDGTAVYTFFDNLFVGLDAGFTYYAIDGASDNLIVPLGFGFGYRLFTHSFIKLFFSLPDVASKNTAGDFNGFDNRVVHLQWVQAFDLSRRCGKEDVSSQPPPPPPASPPPPPPQTPTEPPPSESSPSEGNG